MSVTAPTRPVIVRSKSTEHSRWYGDVLITVLATKDDTEGRFGLGEVRNRPGAEPPPHIHLNEDESFYVIEGQITVFADDRAIPATPGTFVHIPRGTVHTFRVDTEEVLLLVMVSPGGFEDYFIELSVPAESLDTPPVMDAPPDMERIIELSNKYGCYYVGQE